MKTFKQLREECGCKDKERKAKKAKKTVEVMPTVKDGPPKEYRPTRSESTFAGNYEGPLYAPHPDIVQEVAPPGAKYERMIKHIKKGYKKDGKLTDKEKSIAYATAWKAKNKNK